MLRATNLLEVCDEVLVEAVGAVYRNAGFRGGSGLDDAAEKSLYAVGGAVGCRDKKLNCALVLKANR